MKKKILSSDFSIINLCLDPDPDSAKYLDPDLEITDTKHWFTVYVTYFPGAGEEKQLEPIHGKKDSEA